MDTDGDCSISWDEFRKALLGPWDDDEPGDERRRRRPTPTWKRSRLIASKHFRASRYVGRRRHSVSEAASALRDDEEFAEVLGVDVGTDDGPRDRRGGMRTATSACSWSEFRGAVLGATPWGAE